MVHVLPAAIRSRPTAARRAGLALILLVAFVLRVWNLNWDDATHQHPDERHWSFVTSGLSWEGPLGYFDSEDSELNPYTDHDTWVYGTLPLLATKAVAGFLDDGPFPAGAIVTLADWVGIDLRTDGFDEHGNPARVNSFDDDYNVNLVGRLLSALLDTATVALIYILGRDLFDRTVGMAAAGLAAFTVLHIQYSHFHGAEPWTTFFVTLGLITSLRLLQRLKQPGGIGVPATRPALAMAAVTGVALGLAAASKIIAAVALIVPALAIVLALAPSVADVARSIQSWITPKAVAAATLTGLVALSVGLDPLVASAGGIVALPAFVFVAALLAPARAHLKAIVYEDQVRLGATTVTALIAVVLAVSSLSAGTAVAITVTALGGAGYVASSIWRSATPTLAPTDLDAPQGTVVLDTGHPLKRPAQRIGLAVGAGVLSLVAAAITFRVFQPYAFDGLFSLDERFTADLDYLEAVGSGASFPWVVQWIGRTPLLFPLISAFRWGMGPGLGLAVVAGVAVAAGEVVRRRRWQNLLPLSLLAIMLGLVSQQFNPLIRYMMPAYPAAIVFGGYGVIVLWRFGRNISRERPWVGVGARSVAVAMVAITVLWGLAFVNGVYGSDHPRVTASVWMAENLEPDATLTAQIWDDALPLAVPGTEGFSFTLATLDPFVPDRHFDTSTGRGKVDDLLDGLDNTTYIVEASNRLYDAIPRVPAKYPATSAYYRALFDGTLGFEEIARFDSPPSLFGLEIDDADAEETFTVYDHPTVTVWAKTSDWSRQRAAAILNAEAALVAPDLAPSDSATNALMLRPDGRHNLDSGLTFSDTFSEGGATSFMPWLWWLLWIQVAAMAVLPWTTRLFAPLGDSGYGLSKVVGLLAVGLGSWLTVSLGVVDFGRGVVIFWLSAVVIVGLLAWSRDHSRLRGLRVAKRASWLASELVFLAVYGAVVYLRARNPDLWESYFGGEKPMELAYFTAVGRTQELPPYDPWFAGGYMNYYYLGWYLVAVPMRALKILPEVGFQLAIATYAALTAVTSFSIVHNLVAATRVRWGGVARPRVPIRAGLFGVVALLFFGNLDALRQHYGRLEAVNEWDMATGLPVIGHVVTFLGGTWAWIRGADLSRFDWWAPSRVNDGNFDITEFPYFTYLFGDLHPHLMDMAFLGMVVSLAFTYLLATRSGQHTRSLVLAVSLGVMTGVVRAVNTWDLPTALVLAGAAIVVGKLIEAHPEDDDGEVAGALLHRAQRGHDTSWGRAVLIATLGLAVGLSIVGGPGGLGLIAIGAAGMLAAASVTVPPPTRSRILGIIGHGSLMAATHIAVFWPFSSATETFGTGLQSARDHSPFGDFVVHWGVFFSLSAALFVALFVDERRRVACRDPVVSPLPSILWGSRAARLVVIGVTAAALAVSATVVSGAFALATGGALIGVVLLSREIQRPESDVGRIMALGLITLGLAITAGPEVVTVDPDVERMNTVFKFWLQAWQLLALGGAFAVWEVGKILSEGLTPVQHPYREPTHAIATTRRARPGLWIFAVSLVSLVALAYPLLATAPRLETRFGDTGLTLDGLAYLDSDPVIFRRDEGDEGPEVTVALAQDLPLIKWIRDTVAGSPTIVEWTGDLYDWNSRIAIHTGLPTVLGWDWHQRQQRGDYSYLVDRRRADVQDFYRVADPAAIARFLKTYEVSFVVIGTQEHRHGNEDALAAIDTHPVLVEVFRSGDKAIYQVDREALWGVPF